jgi:CMP-N-acetylneuraminic acid synthetase
MLVALFPIKAKSERIKNKNFKLFCGKPLYRWMLDKLVNNSKIDKIIVNTDSNFLCKNKEHFNKKIFIRKRSKSLIGHSISMNEIIKNDIIFVTNNLFQDKKIDFLMTHATNPLISNITINKAYNLFIKKEKKIDSLFSVNMYRSRFYDDLARPLNHNPKKLIQTQFLKSIYEENSCMYFFTKKSFENSNTRIGKKPFMFVSPLEESIDIDDISNWNFAKKIMINNLKFKKKFL